MRVPVDVRSASLGVLAVLACVFTLKWASAVFIPVLLGLMLSYALSPVVKGLHRLRIPRAAGAAVLLLGILGGAGSLLYSLSDDAVALIESLPRSAQRLRLSLRVPPDAPPGSIDHVQKAAAEIERAADESAALDAPGRSGVTRVVVERPRFTINDYLWTGTLGLFALLGQTAMVFLIAFFLLATGDSFRRKMVRLAGPKMSQKRMTLEALDEVPAVLAQRAGAGRVGRDEREPELPGAPRQGNRTTIDTTTSVASGLKLVAASICTRFRSVTPPPAVTPTSVLDRPVLNRKFRR